jgi:hypothetical protein
MHKAFNFLKLLLTMWAFLSMYLQSPAQTFQSAFKISGTGDETIHAITKDNSNNIIIGGTHVGADFDPGPAVQYIGAMTFHDGFLAKYDAAGNYIWAIGLPGTNNDQVRSVKTDAFGNIYIMGWFWGEIHMDPNDFNAGILGYSGAGEHTFVAKYDPSGALQWAFDLQGTTGHLTCSAFEIDNNGNIYIAGNLPGTVGLDPLGGTSTTLTGTSDAFFAKYNSSGTLVYFNYIVSSGWVSIRTLTPDTQGGVYAGGFFQSHVDFDQGAGVIIDSSAGYTDGFIAHYNSSGNYVSHGCIKGPGSEEVSAVLLDNVTGDIYIAGIQDYSANFNMQPGNTVYCSGVIGDRYFLAKYVGGVINWAKAFGGDMQGSFLFTDYRLSMSFAGNGIVVSGYYTGLGDFTFDTGPLATDNGLHDIYIMKTDFNGNALWNVTMGAANNDESHGVVVIDSSVYIGGHFYGTIDFDPGPNTNNLVSSGMDAFVAWYDDNTLTAMAEQKQSAFNLYPNPASERITISSERAIQKDMLAVISDMQGKQLLTINDFENADISDLDAGIYLLNIIKGDGTISTDKLIITR